MFVQLVQNDWCSSQHEVWCFSAVIIITIKQNQPDMQLLCRNVSEGEEYKKKMIVFCMKIIIINAC